MQPDNRLEIYATSRAIREELTRMLSQNTILPKMTTIGEFEKKALLVPGRTFIDEDTRILLMQEASDFSNFRSLNIDREFFSFLKNFIRVYSKKREQKINRKHLILIKPQFCYDCKI